MLRSILAILAILPRLFRRAPKAAPELVMGYPQAVALKGGGYAAFPGSLPLPPPSRLARLLRLLGLRRW